MALLRLSRAAAALALLALHAAADSATLRTAIRSKISTSTSSSISTSISTSTSTSSKRPHVVLILVDDWGHANFGIHNPNNPEVVTPNMNQLANSGIILDRHYTYKMCGPSRCSLQSGRLPTHVSFTNLAPEAVNLDDPISGYAGIPRNMTTIAQKMLQAGYATAMTGKWDAGMATKRHTPHGRGYQQSYGYFHHANDYWNYGVPITAIGEINVCYNQFTDLWHNDGPASNAPLGTYEEDLFTAHTLQVLDQHDPSTPLFLFHSFHLIHTPLQIPPPIELKFSFINDTNRRLYASMVYYADGVVGQIVQKLKDKQMYEDTLIITFSDNGGPIYVPGSANNYPLLAGKYADFEGGVRVNAFVSGGALPASRRGLVLEELVHISDWYATLVHLANFGVGPADANQMKALLYDADAASAGLPQVDSIDAWPVIAGLSDQSAKRTNVWLSEQAYLDGQYKVVVGNQSQAIWTGLYYPNETSTIRSGRTCLYSDYPGAVVACTRDCGKGCLFNVFEDPTEHVDLAPSMPGLLNSMLNTLAALNTTIFNPNRGSPSFQACIAAYNYGGFYGPFVDQ